MPRPRSVRRFARALSTFVFGCALAACAVETDETTSEDEALAVALLPRVPAAKLSPVADIPPGFRTDIVILKLHEGSRVRWDGKKLVHDAASMTEADRFRLKRAAALPPEQVPTQLAQITSIVTAIPGIEIVPFIGGDLRADDAERLALETQEGEELADLGLYYRLVTKTPSGPSLAKAMNALNTLPLVETAYPQPEGSVAFVNDRTPTRESLVASQGYRLPAPGGVDADFAVTVRGGRGAGVRIMDIENGAHWTHEDLKQPFYRSGLEVRDVDHGTMVMGVLAARPGAVGVTGIVPDAQVGLNTPIMRVRLGFLMAELVPWDPSGAILDAANHLRRGDVILIEQHYPAAIFLDVSCPNDCNCAQFGLTAVENWQLEFDAIRRVTARGIVVVEAAGNGQMDLDHRRFAGRFDRSRRDSRAIIVGAGDSESHAPRCFTNFGGRVDVQAWGHRVTTTTWNDLPNAASENQLYTTSFSGTSSASAIVAGVAASVQGARFGASRAALSSKQMRTLLRQTGTAQPATPAGAAVRQIGPLPNLRAAIPLTLR